MAALFHNSPAASIPAVAVAGRHEPNGGEEIDGRDDLTVFSASSGATQPPVAVGAAGACCGEQDRNAAGLEDLVSERTGLARHVDGGAVAWPPPASGMFFARRALSALARHVHLLE